MNNSQRNSFNFICCGSVDDGKSSLIGQILLKTHSVKQDVLDDALNVSFDNGSKILEPSLILDGLIDERNQQITIDIAHRYFDYKNTRYHIFDCPGHEQYTRNMVIAAAEANCAILVIDILKGISPQTLKHISICAIFQIKYIIIALSKCDLIDFKKNLIDKRIEEINELFKQYNFTFKIHCIDSIHDVNIDKVLTTIVKYKNLFYKSKKDEIAIHIYNSKFYKKNRYYSGKFLGRTSVEVGEEFKLYPSQKTVTIKNNQNPGTITIEQDIDIKEGDVISNKKLISSNIIKHHTFWFSPPTNNLLFKHGTTIANITKYTDTVINLNKNIYFNNINEFKENGYGIIIDNISKKTIGVSVFLSNDYNNETEEKGRVYWFTGLSGSGKTTLANHLQNYFTIKPILLDADNVRKTINSDLKYTKEDCLTNVDRISQIAKLLSEQGFNVIVTCISKYKDQREKIKNYIGNNYIEILMNRHFEILKQNDVKGLYKSLGSSNMIQNYEYGNSADIIIDVDKRSEEENKDYLIKKLKQKGAI